MPEVKDKFSLIGYLYVCPPVPLSFSVTNFDHYKYNVSSENMQMIKKLYLDFFGNYAFCYFQYGNRTSYETWNKYEALSDKVQQQEPSFRLHLFAELCPFIIFRKVVSAL